MKRFTGLIRISSQVAIQFANGVRLPPSRVIVDTCDQDLFYDQVPGMSIWSHQDASNCPRSRLIAGLGPLLRPSLT